MIFYFPIIFIMVSLLIFKLNPELYNYLFGILEGGVFEWIQFLCYIFASIIGLISLFKIKSENKHFVNVLLFLFSIGTFFVAMEEISYGQHIFKWEAFGVFKEINLQNETNIHNLRVIMENNLQVKAFIFVGFFGAFSWFLRSNLNSDIDWRDILFVDRSLALYFLPIAIFYSIIILYGLRYNILQELFETVLSFGFLMVAILNKRAIYYYFQNKI